VKRLLLQPNSFAAIAAKQQAARAARATGPLDLHMQQQQQLAGVSSIKAAAAACPSSPVTPVKHAAMPASLARCVARCHWGLATQLHATQTCFPDAAAPF
jgi:hypothetical protein